VSADLEELEAELRRSYTRPDGMIARNGARVLLDNRVRTWRAMGQTDEAIADHLRWQGNLAAAMSAAALAASRSA
jgi:hypothetical protein